MEAVEPSARGRDANETDPEMWTTIVRANLQERVIGGRLPEACAAGEVTWI